MECQKKQTNKQSKLVVAIVVWRNAAGASLPEAAAPLHCCWLIVD
jgi:hypothetical protein